MKNYLLSALFFIYFFGSCNKSETIVYEDNTFDADYSLVDTDQSEYFDTSEIITQPYADGSFFGQDAQYKGNQAKYIDNGNGTVTDLVTGLMWQQNPGDKMTLSEALNGASSFNLAGFTDWRLPSVKELYSLIMFSGIDPSGYEGSSTAGLIPFINTEYFEFEYGNPADGERIIDSQFASSTLDVGDSEFGGGNLMFGVNFADGRIKGYPSVGKSFFVLYVRGNNDYGKNDFVNNEDGTISDLATGLMWMQDDSGIGMLWEDALAYAESTEFAGYDDWRLPNAKELQSIVDYSKAPGTTNSPAIDDLFNCTTITNEAGTTDYPYYWTSTTHKNWTLTNGSNACYLCFGRAMGYFNDLWQDVHGAGAQRSDPKTGNPDDYSEGHGPQGDAIRILNYVRLVRNI